MNELYPLPALDPALAGGIGGASFRDTQTAEEAGLRYEPKIDFMHKILRGELSAVSAYESVLAKYPGSPYVSELQVVLAHHKSSVDALRELLDAQGEIADADSGAWGTFVQTLMTGSNSISFELSLKTLLEGEEHGLKQYQQLLEFPLTEHELDVIETSLVPRQYAHIQSLKRLI